LADRARGSFNATFWNSQKRCLFDVLGDSGADASLRPNQLIAASLDFTMLSKEKSGAVVDLIDQELLTPYGLRTLSKDDPRYRGGYFGDRRNRDQAYHSNHQNVEHVYRNFLEPIFKNQVHQACLGTVNEVFDGDQPHTPRGCISQAWSIAEPLRAYVEDILQLRPKYEKELLSSAET
jgi:glycogen debranching enzyme